MDGGGEGSFFFPRRGLLFGDVLLSGCIKKIPEPFHIRFPSPIMLSPFFITLHPVSYLIIRLVLASFPPLFIHSPPRTPFNTHIYHTPKRDSKSSSISAAIVMQYSTPSGLSVACQMSEGGREVGM